jgi:hypothetical protein
MMIKVLLLCLISNNKTDNIRMMKDQLSQISRNRKGNIWMMKDQLSQINSSSKRGKI